MDDVTKNRRADVYPIGKKNPNLPFHPAVRAGDFIFVSGQVAKDSDNNMIEGSIEVETRAQPEAAQLVVRDEGPGIDEGSRPRLFSPFFSTKPEGRGAGLGLALSYGIVTEHGGTIEARNLPAGGAEFTVTLPARAAAPAAPAP